MSSAAIPSQVASDQHRVNRPLLRAHRVHDDREALAIAHELATHFRPEASLRDARRQLPFVEIEKYSASGLWALTVPKEYGGPAVSIATLAEVTATISEADSSIGQIPQNHYYMLEVVRANGTVEQKQQIYELAGILLSVTVKAYVPQSGNAYLLWTIGAAFIGATLHPEGRPSVPGTLLGVLLLSIVRNGLLLIGWNFYWQQVATGVLMFLVLAFSSSRSRALS